MMNQQQRQSSSRTSSHSTSGKKRSKELHISLKDAATKKRTSATVSAKSVAMTRCSDPSRDVHSCSFGTIADNLVLSNNRGGTMTMTFDEASVLFGMMRQNDETKSLFTSK
jgi:hypothetical protein